MQTVDLKSRVKDFWQAESCGERYQSGADRLAQLESQSRIRYELEPYIPRFAGFDRVNGLDVLEIGVGMGADHAEFAKHAPRRLCGIDLTERAVQHTRERFELLGLTTEVRTGDAENLPFPNSTFDVVYSWGVLHHSPNTARAFEEVHRVLKPGGVARVMIYHKYSIVGLMLWGRYGLLAGQPWHGLDEIYARYLESPGTKAYSIAGARDLTRRFSRTSTSVELGPGDLLIGDVGQRHRGRLVSTAKALYPRRLVKKYLRGFGLGLMIEAVK